MSRPDQAAIAIGLFTFVFTLIPGLINRKNTTQIEFSRGLTRNRTVKRKPTTAVHEVITATATGAIMGLLVWWGTS